MLFLEIARTLEGGSEASTTFLVYLYLLLTFLLFSLEITHIFHTSIAASHLFSPNSANENQQSQENLTIRVMCEMFERELPTLGNSQITDADDHEALYANFPQDGQHRSEMRNIAHRDNITVEISGNVKHLLEKSNSEIDRDSTSYVRCQGIKEDSFCGHTRICHRAITKENENTQRSNRDFVCSHQECKHENMRSNSLDDGNLYEKVDQILMRRNPSLLAHR